MKNMVLLTKEEYDNLMNRIYDYEEANSRQEESLQCLKVKFNNLCNFYNRSAIEAALEKHEAEYYNWCEEVSARYEEKDFEDWCVNRARFYNNGRYDYCTENGITEDEWERELPYTSDKRP